MKKFIQLCAVFMISLTASAQLQNLDFENWDNPVDFSLIPYNVPTGWQNCSRFYGYENAYFSDKFLDPIDTLSLTNNYALRLFTWYSFMKDAAVQTASIDYRPLALKGVYKYSENVLFDGENTIIDTAQILITLTKWNSTLLKTDTIGMGRFQTADMVSGFTPFLADIVYTSEETPDSITILLDPSILGRNPEENYINFSLENASVFTIDNLSLTTVAETLPEKTTTGIAGIEITKTLSLYPNPAGNIIHLEQSMGKVSIMDLNGRIVMNETLNNQSSLDISALNHGVFMVRIQNEEGVFMGKFVKH